MFKQIFTLATQGNFSITVCPFYAPNKLLVLLLLMACICVGGQAQKLTQEPSRREPLKTRKNKLEKPKANLKTFFQNQLSGQTQRKTQSKALVAANALLQVCLTMPDGNTVILTQTATETEGEISLSSLGGQYTMGYTDAFGWKLSTALGYDTYSNSSTALIPPTDGWVANGDDVTYPGSITVVNGRCAGTRQKICVTLPGGFVVTLVDGGASNGAPDFYSTLFNSSNEDIWSTGGFNMYRSGEDANTWVLSSSNGYDTYTNSSTALTPPTEGWVAAEDEQAITGPITVALGACTATPAQLCVSFPDGERVTVFQTEPANGAPAFVYFLNNISGVVLAYNIFSEGWGIYRINESAELFEFYGNLSEEKTVPLTGWVLLNAPGRVLPAKDKAANAELTISTGACTNLSASNLIVSGVLGTPNCSVDISGLGTGKSFVFTGPGNATPSSYVFSNVFRQTITQGNIRATGITQPGTYTLTVSGDPGQPPVVYTIEVTGTPCK